MPPATDPVGVRILADIRTTLDGVVSGTDYFHTLNVVKVGTHLDDVHDFPAALIGVGDLGSFDERDGLLSKQNTHWRLSIVGILDDRDDVANELIRLEHDILKALLTDPQRGGLALDTRWLGATPIPALDDDQSRVWIECLIDVHFRTDYTDRTRQA